jgi:hypothetical protein
MEQVQSSGREQVRPDGAIILDLAAGAFTLEPGERYHKLFLFDPLQRGEKKWGFLIITRRSAEGRVELAAYSYALDEGWGAGERKLESRRASIPEDKLDEVIEGILLRMDEPDSDYREVDLAGRGEAGEQLEYLKQLIMGEPEDHDSGEEGKI